MSSTRSSSRTGSRSRGPARGSSEASASPARRRSTTSAAASAAASPSRRQGRTREVEAQSPSTSARRRARSPSPVFDSSATPARASTRQSAKSSSGSRAGYSASPSLKEGIVSHLPEFHLPRVVSEGIDRLQDRGEELYSRISMLGNQVTDMFSGSEGESPARGDDMVRILLIGIALASAGFTVTNGLTFAFSDLPARYPNMSFGRRAFQGLYDLFTYDTFASKSPVISTLAYLSTGIYLFASVWCVFELITHGREQLRAQGHKAGSSSSGGSDYFPQLWQFVALHFAFFQLIAMYCSIGTAIAAIGAMVRLWPQRVGHRTKASHIACGVTNLCISIAALGSLFYLTPAYVARPLSEVYREATSTSVGCAMFSDYVFSCLAFTVIICGDLAHRLEGFTRPSALFGSKGRGDLDSVVLETVTCASLGVLNMATGGVAVPAAYYGVTQLLDSRKGISSNVAMTRSARAY